MYGIFKNTDFDSFDKIDTDFIKMKINGHKLKSSEKFISIELVTDGNYKTSTMRNSSENFRQIKEKMEKSIEFISSEKKEINEYEYFKCESSLETDDWGDLCKTDLILVDCEFLLSDAVNLINQIGYNIIYGPCIENKFIPKEDIELNENNKLIINENKYKINDDCFIFFNVYNKGFSVIKNEIKIKITKNYEKNMKLIESFIVDTSYIDVFNYLYSISSKNKYSLVYNVFKNDSVNSFKKLFSRLTTFGEYFNNFLTQIEDINPVNITTINPENSRDYIYYEKKKNEQRGLLFIFSDGSKIELTNYNLFYKTNINIYDIKFILEFTKIDNEYLFIDIIMYNFSLVLNKTYIERLSYLNNYCESNNLKVKEMIKFDKKLNNDIILYQKMKPYNESKLYRYKNTEITFNALAKKTEQKNNYIVSFMISNNLLSNYPLKLYGYTGSICIIPFIFPISSENITFSNIIYCEENIDNKIIQFKFNDEYQPIFIKVDENRSTEYIQNKNIFAIDTYKSSLFNLYNIILKNKEILNIKYDTLLNNVINWILYKYKFSSILSFIPFMINISRIEMMKYIGYYGNIEECISIFNSYTNFNSTKIGKSKICFYDYSTYIKGIQKVSEDLLIDSLDCFILKDINILREILNNIEYGRRIYSKKIYIIFFGNKNSNLSEFKFEYEMISINSILLDNDFINFYRFGQKITSKDILIKFSDENINNDCLYIFTIDV